MLRITAKRNKHSVSKAAKAQVDYDHVRMSPIKLNVFT